MKQLILFSLSMLLTIGASLAQSSTSEDHVRKGIELHDNGEYAEALVEYNNALKLNPKNYDALYEISLTYFMLNDLDKAINYCDKIIKSKASKSLKAQAYASKGNALDMLGKPDKAIKEYKNAIKASPNHQLSYYNLGLTYYNIKNYPEAEEALINAVKLNPSHASSHLLLGYTKQAQNLRAQSLLALYNFLLLEPNSNRAVEAYKEMERMQQQGVSQKGDNSMNILVSMPKGGDEGFSAAELMLSMQQATNAAIKKETEITDDQIFHNTTRSFFNILGELKKEQKGFWWSYYVDFFYDMVNTENSEAFSYYISQSKEDDKINNWLEEHPEQIEKLSDWYESKKR
jgi:tetratricopeptide (TPR) repeat protein